MTLLLEVIYSSIDIILSSFVFLFIPLLSSSSSCHTAATLPFRPKMHFNTKEEKLSTDVGINTRVFLLVIHVLEISSLLTVHCLTY